MRLVCLLGLLASCKFTHGALLGDGSTDVATVDSAAATDGNGTPDAPGTGLDAAPGVACYGAVGVWRVCLGSTPMGSFTLPASINTDSSSLCLAAQPAGWTAGGQPPSCFIVRDTITVTTTSVSGTRPLVLVAHADLNIGLLDVASHIGGSTGPAAQSSACKNFQQNPVSEGTDGSGGGAGGSFITAGGNGGRGNGTGAAGGLAASADTAPTMLRGGCRGQPGAGGSGPVGQGGGAVYLLAGAKITITGRINASGAGGTGGSGAKSGGSGGGAGGMIVLYAPSIIGTGEVMANGGGAASGGNETGSSNSGTDPTAAAIQATGGPGGGGAGGAGYANGAAATSGSNNDGGGGGGGGGAGYLRSNIAPLGVVSPPVDVIP